MGEELVIDATALQGLDVLCYSTSKISSQDSSVGRAADCHVTGPGCNTHSNLAGG